MQTGGAVVRRRGRPRMSLRMKVALAGLAGVAAAWLLPRGGGAPVPTTSATPSDRPGVTAVEFALSSIPEGVSFRSIDRVRVFLVRNGTAVQGFVGLSTSSEGGRLYWCRASGEFEARTGYDRYDREGKARFGGPLRDLDRVRVLVAAERVTVFPNAVNRGAPITRTLPVLDATPCPASERVG